MVGRVVNRIVKGIFILDGKEYKLLINNGFNSLYGGVRGFDKVSWGYWIEFLFGIFYRVFLSIFFVC